MTSSRLVTAAAVRPVRVVRAVLAVTLACVFLLSGLARQPSVARAMQAPPAVTAKAVYSIDVTAGVELYALNPDQRRPPASITKIASALVVVKNAKLDETVVIASSDLPPPELGFSVMDLAPGDTVTIEQLLYGMMLPSGFDAANAAARVVGTKLLAQRGGQGDPIAAFVVEMNHLVDRLGLNNTHFTNPTGADDAQEYSSARDLAAIAAEVLKNKTLAKIVRTPSIDLTSVGPESHAFPTLTNTNKLLGEPGIHGVKTGSTGGAGACLVTAKWEHDRNRVITVVLGSDIEYNGNQITVDKRFVDMEAILMQMDKDYRWLSPKAPGEVPGLQAEMAAWQVMVIDDSAIVVPVVANAPLRYRLQLGPAGPPNSQVGRVLFFVGSEQVAERPVFQAPVTASAPKPTA